MAVFRKSKKSISSPPLNQHLPLVAPLPGAPASAIHHASNFCCTPLVLLVVALPSASTTISLQPLVVRLLVTAFGVVCNSPLPRVAPLSFGWLSHIPAHQPLALPPLVWLVVAYSSASASPSHHASLFPLLSRSTSVASTAGTPSLLPSLLVSVPSAGSLPPLPLLRPPIARMWPQGGGESKWMMFVFWEHRWSCWAKKPVVLASSCDKINAKLT